MFMQWGRHLFAAVSVSPALLVPAEAAEWPLRGTLSSPAMLSARLGELSDMIDLAWVLGSAGLVLIMQIGFMLVEAGAVRTKNAINVAQKNLLDFAFATLSFLIVGYMLAFGPSLAGLPLGWDAALFGLGDLPTEQFAHFVFQAMFCGTAATIVSGAVAERMTLRAYVALVVVVAVLIYPLAVHAVWSGPMGGAAFLAEWGFVDFAGGAVVHGMGAAVALAACLNIGARRGRYAADGRAVRFHGHSPVLASCGALLLFVGWLGFNGGSTMGVTPAVSGIVLNTLLAGVAGAAASFLIGLRRADLRRPDIAINGLIGGLVAVTAGAHLFSPATALVVGVCGALAANLANHLIEARMRIDDAVGAIGTHGAAGLVGVVLISLLAPLDALPTGSRIAQFGTQLGGFWLIASWAFTVATVALLAIGRVANLRVSPAAEWHGLNEVEHGARLGLGSVEDAMDRFVHGKASANTRLPPDPGGDAERITVLFNALMSKLEEEHAQRLQDLRARDLAERERLAALADASFEAIVLCVDGVVVEVNDAAVTLLGGSGGEEALRGKGIERFIDPGTWRELRMRNEQAGSALPGLIPRNGGTEAHLRRADGSEAPVEMRFRTILYHSVEAEVLTIADLTARRAAEARVYHLAMHDVLTDLPNRAAFLDSLPRILEKARRAKEPSGTDDDTVSAAALLLIDLDRFKPINDLHGHAAGDKVLVEVARRLRSVLGEHDAVSRLGGDEFAIALAPPVSNEAAAAIAARVIEAVGVPMTLKKGMTIRVGVSVGIALAPEHGSTPDELFAAADMALYTSKEAGRDRATTFEPDMATAERERRALESDLDRAIGNGELRLFLQPRFDLTTGRVGSHEALVRWQHPEHGFLTPDAFVPLAEKTGQIVPIGEWVLRSACAHAAADASGTGVSVNVSARQFLESDLLDAVRGALVDTGLEPGRLELEVTETSIIGDDAAAARIIEAVRELGVRVALDDFGTGYASLAYLSRFAFDTIKIDRSFVASLGKDPKSRIVLEGIVSLARNMGMGIVAEGIEDAAQFKALMALGCDELQGFFLARPAPADEVQTTISAPALAAYATTAKAWLTENVPALRELSLDGKDDRSVRRIRVRSIRSA